MMLAMTSRVAFRELLENIQRVVPGEELDRMLILREQLLGSGERLAHDRE